MADAKGADRAEELDEVEREAYEDEDDEEGDDRHGRVLARERRQRMARRTHRIAHFMFGASSLAAMRPST